MKNHDHLDQLLNSDNQRAISRLVRDLPEEAPSMVWRSETNAKLKQMVPKQRSLVWAGWWRPAFGLAVAAAIAFTLVNRMDVTPTGPEGIEADLLVAHENYAEFASVSDAGLTIGEAVHGKTLTLDPYEEGIAFSFDSL